MAHRGWVKERFLRERRVQASTTVGTEVANAIPVTIALEFEGGTPVKESRRLLCQVFDSSMLHAVATAYTMAETGAGTEVTTTAKPSLVIDTDANGAAQVTITDVSGISTATVYLLVTPLDKPGFPTLTSLTFA